MTNLRNPSKYQQAILEWIRGETGDAIVEAVAGSGKTTTLEMAWSTVQKCRPGARAMFLAFNRSVAEELRKRLPGLEARTLHSLGNQPTKKWIGWHAPVDSKKYRSLATNYLRKTATGNDRTNPYLANDLARLADLARLSLVNLTDENALNQLVEHHNIGRRFRTIKNYLHLVGKMCDEGEALAQSGHIDFTDQLWIPARRKLPLETYDWVFIDESQDLNLAQLELVKRSRAPGGRLLFVGDAAQAIYGFAGADATALQTIERSLGAARLPLSITYRCPIEHVSAASQIVPELEPRPDAPDGTFSVLDVAKALEVVEANDLVLSREVAPAVAIQRYLEEGSTRAYVDDQDRWKQLKGRLAAYQRKDVPPSDLEGFLSDTIARAEASDASDDRQIDLDKALAIVIRGQAADYRGFATAIDRVFAPQVGAVRCLTIHKAKGLEADRVFLIRPDLLPHRLAERSWQRTQEENLLYVALTRAKEDLFICEGELQSLADSPSTPTKVQKGGGIWGTRFFHLRGQPAGTMTYHASPSSPTSGYAREHYFHDGICVHCDKPEKMATRFGWRCQRD